MNKDHPCSSHIKSCDKDSDKDKKTFSNLNQDKNRESSSSAQVLNPQSRFVSEIWPKGSNIKKVPDTYNFMYFVVNGIFKISASFIQDDISIHSGHFFLLSCEQTCIITVEEECHLIIFKFASIISPWNIPYFQNLSNKKKCRPYKFTILPINKSLTYLLKVISNGLNSNLVEYHFHLYCHGLLNVALRQTYSSDELLNIFYNILDDRLEFRSKILQNYTKAHNVNELVSLMGMSKQNFLKVFAEEYGTNVKQWLTENKKKFVLMNLSIPDISVKDLMFRCGFHTPSNFTRFFQQHFKCTPSYAIMHKEKFISFAYSNVRNTQKKKQSQTTVHLK